jgi:hypothetical protein
VCRHGSAACMARRACGLCDWAECQHDAVVSSGSDRKAGQGRTRTELRLMRNEVCGVWPLTNILLQHNTLDASARQARACIARCCHCMHGSGIALQGASACWHMANDNTSAAAAAAQDDAAHPVVIVILVWARSNGAGTLQHSMESMASALALACTELVQLDHRFPSLSWSVETVEQLGGAP